MSQKAKTPAGVALEAFLATEREINDQLQDNPVAAWFDLWFGQSIALAAVATKTTLTIMDQQLQEAAV